MLAADKRKEEKRSDRDDSGFERKRNKKHNFPLKSAMKKQDKKKDRRSTVTNKIVKIECGENSDKESLSNSICTNVNERGRSQKH